MKRLFLLAFVLLSMSFSTWAQVKIALLEPRVSSSSAGVTDMEKAMIRGELRKAIVNHGGYEAFTRADIDQLMKEQDFQRTGMVSENDIKRLGEMSGADYICISTLSKTKSEFYIEAYLINIETGSISNPASQYGEMVNGKLANMLPVCQKLAKELIGSTSTSSSAVSTTEKSTTKIVSTRNETNTVQIEQSEKKRHFSIHVGGAFPMGSFSGSRDGVLFALTDEEGNNDQGGAGTGFNVGMKLKFYFSSNSGLGVVAGADLFYNGMSSDVKDDDVEVDEKWTWPNYLNIPVMVGLNYEHSLSSSCKLYGEVALGLNFRIITSLSLSEEYTGYYDDYDDYYDYEYQIYYDMATTFAFQLGAGLVFNNRFSIGLHYYVLGTDRVSGKMDYYRSSNGYTDSFSEKMKFGEVSPTILSLQLGLHL